MAQKHHTWTWNLRITNVLPSYGLLTSLQTHFKPKAYIQVKALWALHFLLLFKQIVKNSTRRTSFCSLLKSWMCNILTCAKSSGQFKQNTWLARFFFFKLTSKINLFNENNCILIFIQWNGIQEWHIIKHSITGTKQKTYQLYMFNYSTVLTRIENTCAVV